MFIICRNEQIVFFTKKIRKDPHTKIISIFLHTRKQYIQELNNGDLIKFCVDMTLPRQRTFSDTSTKKSNFTNENRE